MKKVFYLSFATFDTFLGGCFVKAENSHEALVETHRLGINPGGEVLIWELHGPKLPDEAHFNKLLSHDYMAEHMMQPVRVPDE